MKNPLRLSRIIALFAVVVLIAAACGSEDSDVGTPAAPTPVAADSPSGLPPNPNPDETPDIGGTCLEGEPECNDTPLPGQEPTDLPPPLEEPEPILSSGQLVDGGLTVPDALATDATGIIAVKGFLVVNDDGARLCELLAESFPPQCGGASISITNYDEVLGIPLSNAQGVSWTDDHASFLGGIVDGIFVVNPLVAQ